MATTAMRQAGNRSSIDKLRIREMSVFRRTIPGKSPARRIAAERYVQAEEKTSGITSNFFSELH